MHLTFSFQFIHSKYFGYKIGKSKCLIQISTSYMQNYNIGSGLSNLGNTCFLNAVLQSLLYTPELKYLLSSRGHSQECKKPYWCIFCEFESIWNQTQKNRICSPYNFIKNLRTVYKKFKLGMQEDSHQFLRYLLQGMQEAQTGKLGKDRENNEQIIRKTKIFTIFGGYLQTCVHCLNCNYKSHITQRYYDLNIQCQKSNTLLQGIEHFFSTDDLMGSNRYFCENCNTKTNARKRFHFQHIASVLTIQLKRFNNMLRKIGKFIQYPKYINLGRYCIEQKKVVMRLYALIVHVGGSSYGGHYYAFVKCGQLWYKMDDSYVSKSNEQTVMKQNAYILFYEKVSQEIKSMNMNGKNIKNNSKQIQIQNGKDEQKEKGLRKKIQQKKIINITEQQLNEIKINSNKTQIEIVHTQNKQINQNNKQINNNNQNIDKDNRKKNKNLSSHTYKLSSNLLQYAYCLQSKISSYRSLRPLNNLRKYDLILKRRKTDEID